MAVLIACKDESGKLTGSGSGFILDSTRGLVATAGSWLENFITVLESPDIANANVEWRFKPTGSVALTVAVDACAQEPVLCSATLLSIRCLPSVHAYLRNTFGTTEDDRAAPTATPNNPHNFVLLSSLVILQLTLPPNCRLEQLSFTSRDMQAGFTVKVMGTPFGALCPPVFFNSLSEGCICKVLGGGDLFVTDARCPSGCEGGVVITGNKSNEVVGVVLCPFTAPGGFPTGLTLCCSIATIADILQEYTRMAICLDRLSMSTNPSGALVKKFSSMLVAVVLGSSWGTGILLSPGVVLTCSHTLNRSRISSTCTNAGPSNVTIMVPSSSPSSSINRSYQASVIYANGRHVPDVALLRVEPPVATEVTSCCLLPGTDCMMCPKEGRHVFAVGYGLENPANSSRVQPLCTVGVVSKVASHLGNPKLIQMTASSLPGMSGGLVFTKEEEGVGMIVGSSREDDSGWVHHDVSYCLPFSWILPYILRFLTTRDESHLKEMESSHPYVTSLWTLQRGGAESGGISKL